MARAARPEVAFPPDDSGGKGAGVLRFMEVARPVGCRIVLHYVSLNLPGQAVMRTRKRVALGGHDVPEGGCAAAVCQLARQPAAGDPAG